MGVGKKLFLSFFAVLLVQLAAFQLIFRDIIVEQIKDDRHQQFLQEREAARLVLLDQLMRHGSVKDPIEWREVANRLPTDMMYKVTVLDANGNEVFSATSNGYNAKPDSRKKVVAEYHFQENDPLPRRTVIQFFTDSDDILTSKGVSMAILYMYGSMLLVGLVMIFILARWILKPVRQLTRLTQEIREGRRDMPFTRASRDEFGDLFRSFADMLNELKASERRQQEMIAAIAHDFRTPLTTIKGYASYISTGRVSDPERIQKQSAKIRQKTAELEELLDELQGFAQESLELPLNYSRIHLHRFIRDVIDDYVEKTTEAGLAFNWKLRVSDGLYIEADEAKLRRVLENLLNNAIAYNKPNGSILLTCDQREHHVLFAVIDKGEGIAEEDLPHVFNKFYRAEKSRNRNRGGTGLGLAICLSIVHRHGGEMMVTSQLGEGSCFAFTIPYVRPLS